MLAAFTANHAGENRPPAVSGLGNRFRFCTCYHTFCAMNGIPRGMEAMCMHYALSRYIVPGLDVTVITECTCPARQDSEHASSHAGYQPPTPTAAAGAEAPRVPQAVVFTYTGNLPEGFLSDGMIRQDILAIVADGPFWGNELVVLAGCNAIKPLKEKNIRSRSKQKGHDLDAGVVLTVVEGLTPFAGEIARSDQFTVLKQDDIFLKYHSAASSTGGLCQRVVDSLGVQAQVIFTEETRGSISAAARAPQEIALSRQIPPRAIAFCHAYLSAARLLPDGWYQGEKALGDLPANVYRMYRDYCRKQLSFAANTAAIEASETAEALETARAAAHIGNI